MTEREKEAASFIIDYAVKQAVEVMKPHFIRQLKERFKEIAREESGICSHCGHTTKKEKS